MLPLVVLFLYLFFSIFHFTYHWKDQIGLNQGISTTVTACASLWQRIIQMLNAFCEMSSKTDIIF